MNAQGELYLTDAVRDLVAGGHRVAVHVAPDPDETEGVNTRVELAAAAAVLRERINEAHMLAGVTIVDPATTWIEPSVTLEADTTVHPFTVIRGATSVAEGAEIGPHAVVIDAVIGAAATVGPFCYVRAGTVLDARSKVGTFVEVKNTRVGEGAKVPHLSYFGDAEVGAGTNVGAGSITANSITARRAKEAHGDRARRTSPSTRCSSLRSRSAMMSGRRPARSSPRMSRIMLSSGSRRDRRSRRVAVESGTVEQTLPGLGAPDMPTSSAVMGRAIGVSPTKRLMTVGPLQPRTSPTEIANQIGCELGETTLKTSAIRRSGW